MTRIGLESPKSAIVTNWDEPEAGADDSACRRLSGPPSPWRAWRRHRLQPRRVREFVRGGLEASPTRGADRGSVARLERVRDGGGSRQADNCIIICSIENVDPMGIHTGDSITVAPALTLTDKEYQIMRDASIACLREIGVDTGGSNVQFAVNPEDGRLIVIEMNPRVSRSSRWRRRRPASRSPRSRPSWPSATRWTSSTTTSPR